MPKTKVLERYPHPKYQRLSVQLRSDSRFYQGVTYLDGKLRQTSLRTSHLPTALKLGEDWYRREVKASDELGKQHPISQITTDPTIGELYRSYRADLPAHQQAYAAMKWSPIQDFWRAKPLSTVGPQMFTEFYKWRRSRFKVKNHTLHKDVMVIRQILKHAVHSEMLPQLPQIPPVGKIEPNPRPWLTPDEWDHLVRTAMKRILEAPNERVGMQRWDALDFAVFLYESSMRVGELQTLRFKSCRLGKNKDGDKMLECDVKGKTGLRLGVVATSGAAEIYERRLREADSPNDLIFPFYPREAFREILENADLYKAHGFTRSYKSVRATSISHKILENPELNTLFVARNSGTSLLQIDNYYAKRLQPTHAKDRLSKLSPAHKHRLSKRTQNKMIEELHAENERSKKTAKRRSVAVARPFGS